MSFASDTKTALCMIVPQSDCCAVAEFAAMAALSQECTREKIVFITENEDAAYLFSGLALRCFDLASSPEVTEKKHMTALFFKTEISGEGWEKAFDALFPNGVCGLADFTEVCKSCEASFLRGAFIAAGFVNPPDKPYDIEFSTESADIAADVATVLFRRFAMPKLTARKGKQIVYYHDAEVVADMLTLLGAKKSALEIMNSQAIRSIRNSENRRANFEYANISKMTAASAPQIEAINGLKRIGKFGNLPPQLQATANLRLANPLAPLSELCEMENPPVSKSQESKRLQRIVDFYGLHSQQ